MNLQLFGGRGGSSGMGGGISSEERASIVNRVEKDVSKMKAPSYDQASTVKPLGTGLEGIVKKERVGGKTVFDVAVWDGTKTAYKTSKDSWKQAKDSLFTRLPQLAVAKAERGH